MAADLPISSQGSGEGLMPVAATGQPARQAAEQARRGEAGAPQPLAGAALWGAGFLLSLANFIALLDTTIANVSVPNIAGGLAVSANEGTWTITSYSVAEAITVPLTGWLSQRFGPVRVFCTAMTLFALFSALCGLSPSLNVLVVFRVLQGLSGGPMIPLSQTLLLRTFPKAQAGQAMAMWAMTTVVAPIAGPILGGLICDNASWPWIFYINVPVALVCSFLAWRALNKFEDARVKRRIDVVGLILMIIWIAALQIMLDKGEDEDWFNSPFIRELLIVAVIGFAVFMIWELTEKEPVINLKVFSSTSYSITLAVLVLAFGSYFAAIVVQPLWLQTNLGYTASWAGFAVAPSGVLSIIASPIVARLMTKYDPRWLIFIGLNGLAGTMFWRAHFASNINFVGIALPQLVQGVFTPMFFVPMFSLALSTLSPRDLAGGAGLLSFARTMAGAFGTSISTTAWANIGRDERVQLLNTMDSSRAVNQIAATGMSHGQAIRQFENMVQTQAVMLATDKVFLTVGVLICLSSFSIWITKRPKAGAGGGGGGH
jgi:MFS transporter, DHA2 family, multidrug resistance protein